MKNFGLLICILMSAIYLNGCASIVSGSTDNFSISSEPSQAEVKILDIKSNTVISKNQTPFTIELGKRNGFFSGKSYQVTLTKPEYKEFSFQINPKASGWYIGGNILFGGFIGWLIVDPATGSMWNLVPEKNNQIMENGKVLTVKLLSDLTPEQKAKLFKIK